MTQPIRVPAAALAPELRFEVEGASCLRYAAAPTVRLALAIESRGPAVHSLLLDVQVRIAARRRRYAAGEQERLADIFGRPGDWGRNLHSLLWTNTSVFVPGFEEATRAELDLPCSYDFEVAAARYLDALRGGQVPLELLFSGTVSHAGPGGRVQLRRLPLDREARFGLPVSVWRETMEHYFPGAAWVRLRRDSFDRLAAYRAREALPTWEAVVERLLEARR